MYQYQLLYDRQPQPVVRPIVTRSVAAPEAVEYEGQVSGLAQAKALGYLTQAAGGAAFLHQHGILHSDVSASNRLVIDESLKLVVFSNANFEPTGRCPNTPFHICPESVRCEPPHSFHDGRFAGPLAELARQMLEKDPELRPGAEEVAGRLGELQS